MAITSETCLQMRRTRHAEDRFQASVSKDDDDDDDGGDDGGEILSSEKASIKLISILPILTTLINNKNASGSGSSPSSSPPMTPSILVSVCCVQRDMNDIGSHRTACEKEGVICRFLIHFECPGDYSLQLPQSTTQPSSSEKTKKNKKMQIKNSELLSNGVTISLLDDDDDENDEGKVLSNNSHYLISIDEIKSCLIKSVGTHGYIAVFLSSTSTPLATTTMPTISNSKAKRERDDEEENIHHTKKSRK
jgi:hypothetical protein